MTIMVNDDYKWLESLDFGLLVRQKKELLQIQQ